MRCQNDNYNTTTFTSVNKCNNCTAARTTECCANETYNFDWLSGLQAYASRQCCGQNGSTGFGLDNDERQRLIRWLIFILVILIQQNND